MPEEPKKTVLEEKEPTPVLKKPEPRVVPKKPEPPPVQGTYMSELVPSVPCGLMPSVNSILGIV